MRNKEDVSADINSLNCTTRVFNQFPDALQFLFTKGARVSAYQPLQSNTAAVVDTAHVLEQFGRVSISSDPLSYEAAVQANTSALQVLRGATQHVAATSADLSRRAILISEALSEITASTNQRTPSVTTGKTNALVYATICN